MKNKVTLSQDGSVAYVTLTQGQMTVIDADDLPSVMQHHWYAMRKKGSDRYYAVTNARDDDGKLRMLQLGRLLTRADSQDRVTYVNGYPLDNRKENLQRREKRIRKLTSSEKREERLNQLKKRNFNTIDAIQINNEGTYVIADLSANQVAFVETDNISLPTEYRWTPLSDKLAKLLVNVREDTDENKIRTRRTYKNRTGFKGVSRRKHDGRYHARISVHGHIKSLGTYSSPELAYAAYCTAAAWYYGALAHFDPEPPEGSVEEWMLV